MQRSTGHYRNLDKSKSISWYCGAKIEADTRHLCYEFSSENSADLPITPEITDDYDSQIKDGFDLIQAGGDI